MDKNTPETSDKNKPCPFCGSTDLATGYWSLDGGEVDSLECNNCYAGAPVSTWNQRHEAS